MWCGRRPTLNAQEEAKLSFSKSQLSISKFEDRSRLSPGRVKPFSSTPQGLEEERRFALGLELRFPTVGLSYKVPRQSLLHTGRIFQASTAFLVAIRQTVAVTARTNRLGGKT
jgi:hypothetical protein